MQHSITDMSICPSTRGFRTCASAFCIIGLVFPSLASARDAFVHVQSSPGYRCNRWNSAGECADWSYYDYETRTAPVYRGSMVYRRQTSVLPIRYAPATYIRRTVSPCYDPTVDCTGRVTVRVRATPSAVPLGELLTYTLYIRNDDSQIRTVSVRAYLDENVDFDAASYGGYEDGNVIRWDTLRIPALSSRSFTMRVRVRSNAPTGSPIQLTVRTEGSIDRTSVNVVDAGYYSNALRILEDGNYIYYNHYTGTRVFPSEPVYYRDEYGGIRSR